MNKLSKNVKNCKFHKKEVIQVIHTKSAEKRGKIVWTSKLSTLSTQKHMFLVDNSNEKRTDVLEIIDKNHFLSTHFEKNVDF